MLQFLPGQFHQRQHVRGQRRAIDGNQVRRGDPFRRSTARQDRGHGLQGWCREHRTHVQQQADLTQALDQADDEEGVTTQFEEVILTTDTFNPEQFLPGSGQGRFDSA